MNKRSAPQLIDGGVFTDNRGSISFVNDFKFDDIKRFYFIQNESLEFYRGWNAHRDEGKYFFAVHGAFKIGIVKIEDWQNPESSKLYGSYDLEANLPKILAIPPGYANCVINKTIDSKLLVFSTMSLKESLDDKIRFPAHWWSL